MSIMNSLYKSAVAVLICIAMMSGCGKNVAPQGKLQAPSPQLEAVGINSVTVVWEAVEGAASYELFINSMTTVTVEGTRCVLEDLQSGTYYTVRMRAIPSAADKGLESSGYGSTLRFTTAKQEMLATPEIYVSELTAVSATVNWRAVSDAGSYVVCLKGGDEHELSSTSYTFADITPGTAYIVMVKALPLEEQAEFYHESQWAEREIVTWEASRLAAPELCATDIHASGFTVRWSAISNAGSYSVRLGTEQIADVTTEYYVFQNLTEGQTYTVKVSANPVDGNSDRFIPSAESSIKVVPRAEAGTDTGSNEDYIIDQE